MDHRRLPGPRDSHAPPRGAARVLLVACTALAALHTSAAGPVAGKARAARPDVPARHAMAATSRPQASRARVHRYWVAAVNGLRSRSEPRDWLLASWLMNYHDNSSSDRIPLDPGRHEARRLLEKAGDAAPRDSLVQAALAAAPPYAYDSCDKRRCALRFDALAKLEPDNAAAWIPVVASAMARQDPAAAERGLQHMAAATRFDDHEVEMARVFRRSLQRYPVPPEENLELDAAMGSEAKQEHLAFEAAESLNQFHARLSSGFPELCGPTAASNATTGRKNDCARIGRMLLRNGYGEGWSYLCGTGLATLHDRDVARLVEWRSSGVENVERKRLPDAVWLHGWFVDLEATHDYQETYRRSLVRQGLPAAPPAQWRPDGLSCN